MPPSDTVQVDRAALKELIAAAKAAKAGFILCAPRFASGSQGEALVSSALKIDGLAAGLAAQTESSP